MKMETEILFSQEQAEEWLLYKSAQLLSIPVDELDPTKSLSSYGLNSEHEVQLAGELSELAGRALSPTIVWDYPSIRALVTHVFPE